MASLELVEIRTLDGANIFLRGPAIKLQVRVAGPRALAATVGPDLLLPVVRDLHRAIDLPEPVTTGHLRERDEELHDVTVAFAWEWRTAAEGIADAAFAAARDQVAGRKRDLDAPLGALREALAADRARGDRPRFLRDADRRIPLVGITGTNGKTTTTRCIAHLLASTGRRVGMANSNGVWIGDEQTMEGDYTGPQGAWGVLGDDSVEIAVLETARGGILLRGIAYESNDVGVVTNISGDHLGLQDIDTVEQLAEVKSLVVRLTRPDGAVVLNGDDPLVRAMAEVVAAPVILFSRQPDGDAVRAHLAGGGRAVLAAGGAIVLATGESRAALLPLAEVPITFGGRAAHMIENALAATAATLGLGLAPGQIAAGLRTFRNNPEQNFGRLHVFALRDPDCTFIVDYAHNEAGLDHLLRFGASYVAGNGRLLAIIGTAGDRPDNVLRALGRLAAEHAAFVWVRETEHYLRGRTRSEMNDLFLAGIADAGRPAEAHAVVPDEPAALDAALAAARPGDTIVMMCFEQQQEILERLAALGTLVES